MRSVTRTLVAVTVALGAILAYVTAFADPGASGGTTIAPSVTVPMPTPLAGVVSLVLAVVALVVRRFAPESHFFHTKGGAAALAAIAAALSAVAEAAKGGLTHWSVLVSAGLGAVLTVLSTYNPSIDPSTNESKLPDRPAAGMKPPDPPAPPNPALFIPFVLPLVFLHFSCATASPATKAFGVSYGACMEQKGLAVALDPNVEKEGLAILTGGQNGPQVTQDLEGLAGRAGLDAVSCLVTSWLGQRGAALNAAGVEGGRKFLSAHEKKAALLKAGDKWETIPMNASRGPFIINTAHVTSFCKLAVSDLDGKLFCLEADGKLKIDPKATVERLAKVMIGFTDQANESAKKAHDDLGAALDLARYYQSAASRDIVGVQLNGSICGGAGIDFSAQYRTEL